ncbi:hypothetical protein E4H12_11545 [Candidatus Thorarchaeota archaeon]|nr:hypothetical protein [Candidatus Thorarchaeota archaeon]TFG96229.1 MAG: hypothetical protein E4H12_11545 [Candidatus Thorarchaeota archaeon]
MTLQTKMGKYLFWADSTIWDIVHSLTDEEYSRDLYENGGSIQRRYVHLAEDLWEWYHDWIGQEGMEEPDFMNMPREKVFSSIKEYSKLFTDMIEERSVDHIEIETGETKIKITFEEILFHLVNHATYHRGQIVMGLRILGKDVVMTDYVPHRVHLAELR